MSDLETKRAALDAIDRAYDILVDMPYNEYPHAIFEALDADIERRTAELRGLERAAYVASLGKQQR